MALRVAGQSLDPANQAHSLNARSHLTVASPPTHVLAGRFRGRRGAVASLAFQVTLAASAFLALVILLAHRFFTSETQSVWVKAKYA